MCLETSWGCLGWFWWRLGAIGRSLGDVLGALGGVLGALLDILEVSLGAHWAMTYPDLGRNPRSTKTLKLSKKTMFFLRCRSSSGGVLGTSWARLGQSCRRSGGLLGTFRALLWGISEALEASRRAKMAQGALECRLPLGVREARERAKRSARSAWMQCEANGGDAIEYR